MSKKITNEQREAVVRKAIAERDALLADCSGGIPCSTCPGTKFCRTGCMRQSEANEPQETMTNPNTPAEPLPCPFCGENNLSESMGLKALGIWRIYCETCQARGTISDDRNAAISAWNRRAEPAQPVAHALQQRVKPWMLECFGEIIAADTKERNHRFLEESIELAQSCGCTASEAHQLVDYVYGRPVGEKHQEVGGVMITLAALCLAHGIDMHEAGEVELARIWTKVEQIRAKQAAKPRHSPLPNAAHPSPAPAITRPTKLEPITAEREMQLAQAYFTHAFPELSATETGSAAISQKDKHLGT